MMVAVRRCERHFLPAKERLLGFFVAPFELYFGMTFIERETLAFKPCLGGKMNRPLANPPPPLGNKIDVSSNVVRLF